MANEIKNKQPLTTWKKFCIGLNSAYIVLSLIAILIMALIIGNVIKVDKGDNFPKPETKIQLEM